MNNTPETDAEKFYSNHHGYYVVHAEHAEDLERERNELRAGLLAMISAANAVVERWETPSWKEALPTATFIHALRDAVDKMKGVMP